MLKVELASKILSYCNETDLSVSELTRKVGGNYENTMAQLKELRERSLLLSEISRDKSVGRPRHLLRTTPLGKRFINEYQRLHDLSLRSSDNDINRVLKQAELTRRLIERGISPYARFQEINELARNVASTAKITRNTRTPPEDLIVNKLARRDRGVQDELDVVSVLELQKSKLDYPYLKRIAKQANVIELLETLMQKLSMKID